MPTGWCGSSSPARGARTACGWSATRSPIADVIEHAQRSFVPLKLRSDVHEQLALGFNLSGLPATVLVAPNREIVAIHQGYLGPDELEQAPERGAAAWRGREPAATDRRREVRAKTGSAPTQGRDPSWRSPDTARSA